MIFGGKRMHVKPLVVESFNWQNGVFLASRMGSETTAAAIHEEGVVRRDPMAMLPFCGYNMAAYFRHWLDIGKRLKTPPKIFSVNWFKVDDKGDYIWPGFSENIRVLEWIIKRVNNSVGAEETPIGFEPRLGDLNTKGLDISKGNMEKLFKVDGEEWNAEAADIENFFKKFGPRMPKEIWDELNKMKAKLRGG